MRKSRQIKVGSVRIGGGAPVSVQSMTKTDTRDADATLAQIEALAQAGCEIIRVAVPDAAAVAALRTLVSRSPIPVIADIHFDARLALAAIDAGAHAIRINPGNLGNAATVTRVAQAVAQAGIAVRIGVNAGSLDPRVYAEFGGATPAAMVASATRHCARFEDAGCRHIKVSLKTSDVPTTVAAYRQFAASTDYPLHLGVTEAGTLLGGTIKSAVALGALLLDGIGDTIRVSLSAPSVEEVRVGIRILEAVGLRQAAPDIVSCPTCGRTRIQLLPLVTAVEREIERLKAEGLDIDLHKVAIMGCVVNGPGEAREADLGIAGGDGKGVLFRNGKVVETVPEARLLAVLVEAIRQRARPRQTPPAPAESQPG